jgi:hypothetical protein
MPAHFPPVEESYARLHRSGWSLGGTTFTSASGGTVHQDDGSNGENRIRVEGASPAEAWHRALEAAATCGMLEGWPRPASG